MGAAGKPVVTFPIPGVPGATGTATLDAKYMTEKVVVTQGATTTEFTYSDYQDWNNPLNKIEVFYAGKMVEREERRGRPRPDDEGDGDGQRVCGCARAGKRAGGDQRHHEGRFPNRVGEAGAADEQVGAHAAVGRASRPDGQLGSYIDWIGNYMTGGGRRCGPTQEKGCNRVSIRLKTSSSTRPRGSAAESSTLQAGALGQSSSSSTCGRTSTTRS